MSAQDEWHKKVFTGIDILMGVDEALTEQERWNLMCGQYPPRNPDIRRKYFEHQQLLEQGWTDREIVENLAKVGKVTSEKDHDEYLRMLSFRGPIQSLPAFSRLKVLQCSGCFFLKSLPSLASLEDLSCCVCEGLESIGPMPFLKYFNCHSCWSLRSLPDMPELIALNCTNCRELSMPDNCRSPQVAAWIKPWQEKGLMPQDGAGRVLVWKCVSPDLVGNLHFPYELEEQFENTGMACAGPWGALKTYDNHRSKGSRVMAIWASCIYPVDIKQGIYHVLRGVPAAVYLATDITEGGFTPTLWAGHEDDYMAGVLDGDDPSVEKEAPLENYPCIL